MTKAELDAAIQAAMDELHGPDEGGSTRTQPPQKNNDHQAEQGLSRLIN
jgi:hypothetical protein